MTHNESIKQGDQGRYLIQAIEKAIDVIELLSEYQQLNLIELSDLLNKPKSSVYRILLTLESRGFVARNEKTEKYELGLKVLTASKRLLENNSLRARALSGMRWLSAKYGDTVNLGVLHGDQVVYMEVVEGTNSLRMAETVGSTSPIHATAMGKAILAHEPPPEMKTVIDQLQFERITERTITDKRKFVRELDQVRQRGYAIDDEEIVIGAKCVAVPIFHANGRPEGAMSISGAAHRYTAEGVTEMARDMKRIAMDIAKRGG